MELVHERAEWRALLDRERSEGSTIALVPTMGALHEGHLSLVGAAKDRCDFVAMTIFVNPLQFGDPLDLASYPRTLDSDCAAAKVAGVSAVFAPSPKEMYPEAEQITVDPGPIGARLEGASRPGHFSGVTTVVTKLFGLAAPCTAFFGEKDYQQLVIVRMLVTELDLPVEVVGCPTVREPGGLAMSSRNEKLSSKGRLAALALSKALERGNEAIASGEKDPEHVGALMRAVLEDEPLVRPDYALVADGDTLQPVARITGGERLLVAAIVEGVRLIDNAASSLR